MFQPRQDSARQIRRHPLMAHHQKVAHHQWMLILLLLPVLLLAGCFSTPTPQPTPKTAGEFYRSNYTVTPTPVPSLTPTYTEVVSAQAGTPVPAFLPVIDAGNAADLIQVASYGGGILQGFAWSPDGSLLAVATTRSLTLYARPQGEDILVQSKVIDAEDVLRSMAFSPDGRLLAVGADSGWITVYNTADGTAANRWQASSFAVLSLAYAPTGTLASTTWDGALRLWSTGGSKLAEYGSSGEGWVEKMVFSLDGSRMFAWSSSRPLNVFDVENGKVLASFIVNRTACQQPITAAFSSSGEVLATSCDSEVRAFNTADGYSLGIFDTGEEDIRALAVSPAGEYLAVAGTQTIRLYRLSDDSLMQQLTLQESATGVIDLAFSPDGEALGILGDGLTLWNISQISLKADVRLSFRVNRIAVSSAGKGLAAWRSDSTQIRLLEVGAQPATRTNADSVTPVMDAAFSPDGSLLAVVADALRLVSVQNAQTLAELTASQEGASYQISVFHEDSGITTVEKLVNQVPLASAAFSPDGLLVAAGGYNRAVYLYDLPGGDPRQAVLRTAFQSADPFVLIDGQPDSDWIKYVAFSSDGKLLAAYHYGFVDIWDVASGTRTASIPLSADTPTGQPCHLSFTGVDASLLAAWEKVAYTYDLASGSLVETSPSLCGMPWTDSADMADLSLPGATLSIAKPAGFPDSGSLIYLPAENTLVVEHRFGGASVVQFWLVEPGAVNGSLLHTQPAAYHTGYALTTALLSETGALAQAWEDGSLLLTDPVAGTKERFSLTPGETTAAAISSSGNLAAFANPNSVLLWDYRANTSSVLQAPANLGGSLAFSPDGSLLAASLKNQTLLIWRTADQTILQTLQLPAPLSTDQAILFSGDGSWLAARTNSGIALWGWDDGTAQFSAAATTIEGNCLAFSPDGNLAAICSEKQVMIYQITHAAGGALAEAQWIKTIPSTGGSLAFSPDSSLLAVMSLELSLWDVQSESQLIQLDSAPPYGSLFFFPGGELLAVVSSDGRIVLYGAP